ncbi:hypothetical protein EYE40_01490 [Glaciihabitans arcticus]|uniref:Ig-like domain-containing protein n=1 Tax=Glaciihabitans arcticus TaxID=2668039 RepID=A0A4Q9GVG5_9MICO|nr:hypothetical protein [Glaciihabitans arcticus]TBN56170.1 hypothetical protein EYE40_01490 [Glaciihabitans arcticus]
MFSRSTESSRLPRLSKPAAWFTTAVLTLSGVAFSGAPAFAADSAELVVVSVDTAGGTGLATPSLVTVNSDGTASSKPTVSLPAAADGTNKPLSLSGSSSAQGYLKRSADGRYLVLTGYAGAPGSYTAGDPKDSTAAALERVIGRVDNTGAADTSTGLGAAMSLSHSRAATSADGSAFYVTGNGADGTPAGGVLRVDLGGANATSVSGAWANTRVVDIADGKLFATSDKTPVKGLGFWPNLPTTSTAPTAAFTLAGTPTDFALLDVDATVPGVDTAYVIAEGAVGIAKFTSNGTAWTARGTRPIAAQSLTARVNNGAAELFVVQGSAVGNSLVSVTDTAAAQGAAIFSDATVLSTSTGTTSYRGVALAPAGWNPVAPEVPEEPANLPIIVFSRAETAGTVGRTDNPTTTFIVSDEETAAADLTVAITGTSNSDVVDEDDVSITGSGAERTVTVTPRARGYRAALTFTVTDADGNTGTATLTYSASGALASSTGFYYYGSSDTSTIVEAGDGYILTANDENQTIGLYKQGVSGYAVKEFSFPAIAGSEIDIEGADRVGNVIYWTGSHGNSRTGGVKVERRNVFSTTVTGEGASTELAYGSSFSGLWSQLRDWDSTNGHGLGANTLGFVAATAEGVLPNPPSGFNIEGFEFAPGSTTTAYFGFRAPSIGADQNALIVPVTNLPALVGGEASQAAFGAPILLDLGGRTIRAIAKNAADQYLISAGPGAVENSWALYTWDGDPLTQPAFNRALPDTDAATTGSWESIAPLPANLAAGAAVELIADTGDATLYNGTENKDLNVNIQKAYSDTFELAGVPATVISFDATISGRANVNKLLSTVVTDASPSGVTFGYQWLRNGTAISKATASTYRVTSSDYLKRLSVRVTATKTGLAPTVRTSAATAIVGKKLVAVTGVPTVTGSATVGATLTISGGAVKSTPSSGTKRTYRWYADGLPIAGATSTKYVVGAATIGKTITARIAVSKSGYASGTTFSAPTAAVVPGAITSVTAPRITGTAKSGSVLTATGDTWSATGIAKKYAWYATFGDETPVLVQLSTAKTFVPTWEHVGAVITVEITATRQGFSSDASDRSAATAVVR